MGKNTDIREAVAAELGYDPLVDAKDITVENLNGDVVLGGTVGNYPQYLEAAEAAWRVAGVTNVHNHLEVVLPPGDVRDDAMLTTAVNDALAANVTVPEATARNGNLTLTGTVNYGSQRAAAEKAVRELTGVRNVKDEIEVAFAVDPADVSQLVKQALHRSGPGPSATPWQAPPGWDTASWTSWTSSRSLADPRPRVWQRDCSLTETALRGRPRESCSGRVARTSARVSHAGPARSRRARGDQPRPRAARRGGRGQERSPGLPVRSGRR